VMVVIGDAVGYELAGTMVSAVVKSCCDEVMRLAPLETSPAALLETLNASLYRQNRPALASCLAMLFDADTGTVTYANAGHLQPYCLHATTAPSPKQIADVRVLQGAGPLLGDLERPEFKLCTAPLDRNGCFVMLSDGMLAPRNDQGDDYGYRRFHRMLKMLPSGDPQALRDGILGAIGTYSASGRAKRNSVPDDQALLVVKCS
jgi:serine phosphatase RsbU (regulator of sigma subunit)